MNICSISYLLLGFVLPSLALKKRLSPNDPHSYSNPEKAFVSHLHLDLDVNFDRKVLTGDAQLTVNRKESNVTKVILDCKKLKIFNVTESSSGKKLRFWHGAENHPIFGTSLTIVLPKNNKRINNITINYETTSEGTALAWMDPPQTAGKKFPYLYSQCQAIHCRSMVPLQDTPGNKFTYTAQLTVPSKLVAVMSSQRNGNKTNGSNRVFYFNQPVPIPAYLLALVVGSLESRQIGPISHVWSEAEIVDKAAWEFAETEKLLETAKGVCGNYVWGIYDILVLPPSFPYGGMENPCLTFVTPTILAGDRSETDVIAHEVVHSWIGNLVTYKNSEHNWLNEGITNFIERKIAGRVRGSKYRDLSAYRGWKGLEGIIKRYGKDNLLTTMTPNLDGEDPDSIPRVYYEKGHTLLWYLEEKIGGEKMMDPFLKAYVDKFKYKSIDSYDFENFFMEYFKGKVNESTLNEINWKTWFTKPGMPPYTPKFDTTLADNVIELVEKWQDWNDTEESIPFTPDDLNNMTARQISFFLSHLSSGPKLPVSKLIAMDDVYGFDSTHTSSIKARWLKLSLKSRWDEKVDEALRFVTNEGIVYAPSIFKELNDWKEKRDLAIEVFEENEKYMMPVSRRYVRKELEI